jgi:hypothetical protein
MTSRWYRPGTWTPHCTLGIGIRDVGAAIEEARAAIEGEIEGLAVSIRLMDFPAGRIVCECPLQSVPHNER